VGPAEGVTPSSALALSTSQNRSLPLFETILLSSTSIHFSSFASVPPIARTASHHRFVLIASVASCPCPPSFHPSLTHFASMAPSSFNNSDEMRSQRTRSKSDADIDYSSQGKCAAFISIMLVMFHAVIRRASDISSQSPLLWVLVSTTRHASRYQALVCLRRVFSMDNALFVIRKFHLPATILHSHLPCSFFLALLLLHHQTSTSQYNSTGLSTILIFVRSYRVLLGAPLVGSSIRTLGRRLCCQRSVCHRP
jgi:hypothetical protein